MRTKCELWKLLCGIFFCFLFGDLIHVQNVNAIDWETSAEVASCVNGPSFEKDAERSLAILRQLTIQAQVIFFQEHQGIYAITENPKRATKWVIIVNAKNASAARKALVAAKKKGLDIVINENASDPHSNGR
jgi:hypothetical protein